MNMEIEKRNGNFFTIKMTKFVQQTLPCYYVQVTSNTFKGMLELSTLNPVFTLDNQFYWTFNNEEFKNNFIEFIEELDEKYEKSFEYPYLKARL